MNYKRTRRNGKQRNVGHTVHVLAHKTGGTCYGSVGGVACGARRGRVIARSRWCCGKGKTSSLLTFRGCPVAQQKRTQRATVCLQLGSAPGATTLDMERLMPVTHHHPRCRLPFYVWTEAPPSRRTFRVGVPGFSELAQSQVASWRLRVPPAISTTPWRRAVAATGVESPLACLAFADTAQHGRE